MTFRNALWLLLAFLGCGSASMRPTTDPETAVRNLDAQIDGLRQSYRQSGAPSVASQLIETLLARAGYLGSYQQDFAEAEAIVDELGDHTRSERLARARFLLAVHRFTEASQIYSGETQTDQAEETLALARGQDLEAVAAQRLARLSQHPTYSTRVDTAAVLAALGRFEEADVLWQEARDGYLDVSPFPLAWVEFQRGVMWGEQAGVPERAREHYEAAVGLLPHYASAQVHLSELEFDAGQVDRAIERLLEIQATSEDPEPASRLAQYYRSRGQNETAASWADTAHQKYQVLLTDFPDAFLDHASEFYANAGQDAELALELAQRNLLNRQNHRAYIVAIRAAEAADDMTEACRLADESRQADGNNHVLDALVGALPCP